MKLTRLYALAGAALICASINAATVTKLPERSLAPLRGSVLTQKITLTDIPLFADRVAVIELEEFQVWGPDAKVILHGDNGVVLQRLDPPPMRFFRGLVNADPDSFAYFTIDPSGKNLQALIVVKDKKFAIASQRPPKRKVSPFNPGINDPEAVDAFLTAYDDFDSLNESGEVFTCETDGRKLKSSSSIRATGVQGRPVASNGISGTQSYAVNIEIETDNELYVSAGSNSLTLTNYIATLTGAVSTIYNRDLHTNVTQRNLHIYTSAADPWSASSAGAGLDELGDYYFNTYGPAAGGKLGSGTIMLSGKSTNSGIAWEGIVCANAFLNGAHYAGPYAWAGSIGTGGLGTTDDPNASPAGQLYGQSSNMQQTYWPLIEYAHELGHVMGGHHTHCVAITDAERLSNWPTVPPADGSAQNSTSNFVDHCHVSEVEPNGGAACYAGTTDYHVGSQTLFKGTIMSYCHNVFVGGIPQSRYTFGQAAEPNHHELDDYMLRATGPVDPPGGPLNIVNQVGSFTISAITAPASVGASSTGNTASITPIGGATYQWSILPATNTITGGATTASITFSAAASGTITLRATAFNTNGCGVTDTKAVVIGTAVPAPTNVVAAATSNSNVHVSWTAATGAVSYQIFRAQNLGGFSGVPTATVMSPATTYDDSGVSQNKAYLYKVRTVDAGMNVSADSNVDFATVVIFADDPLVSGVAGTRVKQQHLTDLRNAVNALRTTANVVPNSFAYQDAVGPSLQVRAVHITDLRTALDAARAALFTAGVSNSSPISYMNSTLTIHSSLVRAVDFQQLRNGTK